jgi:hypothetical protein
MPITGKLTSVTAYSNSIRENILLASLLFEWVKKDKRGARESRAGSRILRFLCILEPQIRFRTSPNRNERYRALAVPCILDKIIDQNGPVGSLLRFRSSGEDALILYEIYVLSVNEMFEGMCLMLSGSKTLMFVVQEYVSVEYNTSYVMCAFIVSFSYVTG